MENANYYKKRNDNKVQCQLCHHSCLITNNQTGICNARKNLGGILYSLNYGYPITQNIDPIEKKPLFHFLPGTETYSIGTLGCNFKCANCQNWTISQAKNIEKNISTITYVKPEAIVKSAIENDCQSIAYTYNEPTVFTEYALEVMKIAHANGIKNIWVSNGYMSKTCLNDITPYLDAINIDLKSIDANFYKNNCSARIEPVLENLKNIKKSPVHLEITTLIIPNLSSEPSMLQRLAEFIANELGTDIPWHIARFSPESSWKLKALPPTLSDIIITTHEIGKDAGLKYVYVGNLPGDQRENTFCSQCNKLVIQRFGYDIERYDKNGRCPKCDTSLDLIL